jgi:DNA primase
VAIHDVAVHFYRDQLECSWVPGYLTKRGFRPDVLRCWQVGYAPASGHALVRHLRSAGYPDSLIQTAGLARMTRTGALADTFRDRAVLPIRDGLGRVVAFIGRVGNPAYPARPKYMNSPSTPLYRKGEVLFGLWQSAAALNAGAVPVIAEGPLDAIAIAIAGNGRYAPVALCGTVLTARQVDLLGGACDLRATGALVAFDGDGSGHSAAARAYHRLSQACGRTAAVAFPAGSDPAQILADRGPEVLAALLRQHLRPLADLVLDAGIGAWSQRLRFAEGQVGALRAGAAAIAAMPARDVPRQVGRLAELIGLNHASVTEAVTDALTSLMSS